MKYIRYVSDIHLDHDKGTLWTPPAMEGDLDTTLIIAGDLWVDCKHIMQTINGESWMSSVAPRFKYIVYVLGNHDLWKTRLDTAAQKCKEAAIEQDLHNVFLLDCESINLDGNIFVGGTLFTDYGNRNPLSMLQAKGFMNDYRLTRFGEEYRKMSPEDCLHIFDKTKKLVFNTKKPDTGKLIVVTHMAPSHLSVHEKYRNKQDAMANTWYYSELGDDITGSDIDYYFHGHVHSSFDYTIGNTRVLCNPRGYVNYENGTGWNECARIELNKGD